MTQPLLDLQLFEDTAAVFKGLSEPTRVAIVALLLMQEEMCVCDIENVLGITQSRSSRHLRYLANAGLVSAKRLGPWMHYRIATTDDPVRLAVVDALRATLPPTVARQLRARLTHWRRHKGANTCDATPAAKTRPPAPPSSRTPPA